MARTVATETDVVPNQTQWWSQYLMGTGAGPVTPLKTKHLLPTDPTVGSGEVYQEVQQASNG